MRVVHRICAGLTEREKRAYDWQSICRLLILSLVEDAMVERVHHVG